MVGLLDDQPDGEAPFMTDRAITQKKTRLHTPTALALEEQLSTEGASPPTGGAAARPALRYRLGVGLGRGHNRAQRLPEWRQKER